MGDESTADRLNYEKVAVEAKVVDAGGWHNMMLKQDGSVWSTGHNQYGHLGDGSTIESKVFVSVVSGGARVIAAGAFHSMVFKEDGSVWETVSNQDGQYDDGSTVSQQKFIRVAPFENGAWHDTTAYK